MKKLGNVSICGVQYAVQQRSQAEDPRLEDAYGYCSADLNLIVLEDRLSPSCARNILLHETLHAIFGHSGVREMLEKADTDEEILIRVLVPHLINAIASMSKWRTK